MIFFLQENNDGQTKPTKAYKGVHFGKLTSKRTDFTGKFGPGPGDYEPYVEYQMRPENLNAKEEPIRYEANIPRYNEQIIKEQEKKVYILTAIKNATGTSVIFHINNSLIHFVFVLTSVLNVGERFTKT